MTTVFLTDGEIRRTLAGARALDAAGFEVASGSERRLSLTGSSRSCRTHIKYPSPRRAPTAFVDELLAHLRTHPTAVLLPMAQETLDLVLARRAEFERVTRLPFAANHRYMVFRDKARTMALAEQAGLPIAPTVWPGTPTANEVHVANLTFPVIIKPRFGWASRGMRVVRDPTEFGAAYASVDASTPLPLVQQFIPVRDKYHVHMLVGDQGQLLAANANKELRHHPYATGASTAQRSVDRPDLIEMALALLVANDWYGLASVDILVDDRDGSPFIAEVNPRFPGTLHVAAMAGVDLASMVVKLALGEPQEPVVGGIAGVTSRCFFPYDLMYLGAQVRARRKVDREFFSYRDTHDDIIDLRDPGPAVTAGLSIGQMLFDPNAWSQLAGIDRVGDALAKFSSSNGHSDLYEKAIEPLFNATGPAPATASGLVRR